MLDELDEETKREILLTGWVELPMEKRGVIDPDITPNTTPKANKEGELEKKASIEELDDDITKQWAELSKKALRKAMEDDRAL